MPEKAGGQKNRYEDLFFVFVVCFICNKRQSLEAVKLADKFGLQLSFYAVAKEHRETKNISISQGINILAQEALWKHYKNQNVPLSSLIFPKI